MTKSAVVLLSGGLDSCVAAASAQAQGRSLVGLAVSYGQRHLCELDAAENVARALGIRLHTVRADIGSIARGPLTGEGNVIKGRSIGSIRSDGAPSTFVPARNAIFLALASTFARSIQASEVWIGSNMDDAAGYPDCREEFFRAFEIMAKVGGFPIEVRHPLTQMTKSSVVDFGRELNAPIDLTWSCYSPVGDEGCESPCGQCDACVLRAGVMR